MRKVVGVLSCFLFTFSSFSFLPTSATHDPSYGECKDVQIIFADGSGATIDGTNNDYLDFREAMTESLENTGLSFGFYELGSEIQGPYQYPAIGIGVESIQNFMTTIGAIISAGKSYSYGESFKQGIGELNTYLTRFSTDCPNTKYVLAGFSQGAGVLSMGMSELTRFSDMIIYVATFGDAKLYLPEGSGVFPAACRGADFSEYREYVPDCEVVNGILGPQIPYQADGFKGKVGAWCNHFDMICTSRINWFNLNESMDPHGSYGNARNADRIYYKAASEVIYKKVLKSFGMNVPEEEKEKKVHNLAILIDTTGSMKNLIDQYKKEALRLSKDVFDQGGKVAIYEYRDLKEDNFKPVLHCSFETCSTEKIEEILNSLRVDGGGDEPESLLSTSLQAMNELKWEQGAVKSIVALTDAGYHKTELVDGKTIGLQDVKLRSLEIDPVNIYTITPESVKSEYLELTSETGGKSFSATGELTFSTEYILNRPDVKLAREDYYGLVGEEFFFDASGTTADGEVVKYEWDLDFDGIFETETSEAFVSKVYNGAYAGFIQVRATDVNGLSGTMAAKVEIIESGEERDSSLEIVDFMKDEEGGTVKINFSTDGYRTLVFNNDVLIGVVEGKTVEISEVDFSVENRFSLVPYSEGVSLPGKGSLVIFNANSKEEPSDSLNNEEKEVYKDQNSDESTDFYLELSEKEGFYYPKNPDCGILK